MIYFILQINYIKIGQVLQIHLNSVVEIINISSLHLISEKKIASCLVSAKICLQLCNLHYFKKEFPCYEIFNFNFCSIEKIQNKLRSKEKLSKDSFIKIGVYYSWVIIISKLRTCSNPVKVKDYHSFLLSLLSVMSLADRGTGRMIYTPIKKGIIYQEATSFRKFKRPKKEFHRKY